MATEVVVVFCVLCFVFCVLCPVWSCLVLSGLEAGFAIRPDTPLQRAGSQGFSLKPPPMDVLDAEGLDLDQVGEDKTCGKQQ